MTERRFSPCVGICSATSLGDKVCVGCGRTRDEVTRWNTMTQGEREEIWQRVGDSRPREPRRLRGQGYLRRNARGRPRD